MDKFTAVLQRPLVLAEAQDDLPEDCVYIANRIEAEDCLTAVKLAQQEVYQADLRDWGKKAMANWEIGPLDYPLLVLFEGHHNPVMYGFQHRQGGFK